MPVTEYLTEEMILALDEFAIANKITDRQEAVRRVLGDALVGLGYLPHEPEVGMRVENLTTENDR